MAKAKTTEIMTRPTPTKRSFPDMVDATEPYEMTVTLKHVKGAITSDKQNCAGARCIKDSVGVEDAWVTRTRTYILFEDGRMVRYANPVALEKTIDGFDSTGFFMPGTYKLVPPVPSQALGTKKGDNVKDNSRPHLTRQRPVHALR